MNSNKYSLVDRRSNNLPVLGIKDPDVEDLPFEVNGLLPPFASGEAVAFCITRQHAERVVAALNLYDELEQKFKKEDAGLNVYPIDSSWIEKIGYDKKTGRTVLFKKDGGKIVHLGVPFRDVRMVINPGPESGYSTGSAYNLYLKGKYATE